MRGGVPEKGGGGGAERSGKGGREGKEGRLTDGRGRVLEGGITVMVVVTLVSGRWILYVSGRLVWGPFIALL